MAIQSAKLHQLKKVPSDRPLLVSLCLEPFKVTLARALNISLGYPNILAQPSFPSNSTQRRSDLLLVLVADHPKQSTTKIQDLELP